MPLPRSLHLRRHHLVVGREVENLLVVPSPPGATTTAGRNLPFAAPAGTCRPGDRVQDPGGVERHHVNLLSARFLGGIGYPSGVGRELSVISCHGGLHKRTWLAVPSHRQDPDVSLPVH